MAVKRIVIVDIDGTIAKVGDRIKYLHATPPDYDKFYEACFDDEPIQEIIDLVKNLYKNYTIKFCTGRRESVRDVTETWLLQHSLFGELLMRADRDYRHDSVVKPSLLREAGIQLENIAFVLDDRDSMVKKWRELGLKCLQVDYGDF
jgi:hypothetical protein